MQTLGQRLRAEREKKGLNIPELASRVCIRASFFEAIEADKPEEFPGKFFYRSFLRQYAGLLEMSEAEIQAELDRSLSDEQAEKIERDAAAGEFKPEVPPMPTGHVNVREETRRWVLRLSVLLGVLVLCSGVYFFWQRWGQRLFDDSWHAVAAHPAQTVTEPQPVVSKPPAPPVTVPQPAESEPDRTSQPAATPSVPDARTGVATSPNPSASKAAAPAIAPPNTAAKVVAPIAGAKAHGSIEIQATGICWVSGWRDGKQFLAASLRAGDTRLVEGGGVVRLQFGSSGDVALKVDGQPIKPIGARGEPRTLEYQNGAYHLLDRVSRVAPKP